jgi:copper transport protein
MRPPTRRRRLLVALLAACWLLLPAVPVSAHAVLVRSEPATGATVTGDPPGRVVLYFSERVKIRFGGVRVFDASLRRVDEGEPRFLDDRTVAVDVASLSRGSYVVAWRVVSADTHPIRGAFHFAVGAPSAPDRGAGEAGRLDRALEGFGSAPQSVLVAASVARALGYLTALALFGTLLFLLVAWRSQPGGGVVDRAMWRSSGRLLRRVWPAAVVASVLLLTTEASTEAGTSLASGLLPSTLGPVLDSTLGRVWIVRMVLLAALVPLFRRRSRDPAPVRPREAARSVGAMAASPGTWDEAAEEGPGRAGTAIAAVLAGGVVVTPAFWGHATTSDSRALALLSDTTHLLAVSAWVGGLLCLLFLVPHVLREAAPDERAATLARTVPRFSRLSLACVGLLVASGAYLAVVQVTAWKAMFDSAYGNVVVAKIVGLALALVLAAFNLLRSQRHLRAAAGRPEESAVWARRLRRAVGGEVVATTVVVVLAAVLVSLAPPRATGAGGAVPGQFTAERVPFGPDTVTVSVHPTRVGRPAQVHTQFSAATGAPDDAIESVTASLTLVDEDLGPFEYQGTRLAPGHFVVEGFDFPVRGTWRLVLSARRGEFDEFRHTFEFRVG